MNAFLNAMDAEEAVMEAAERRRDCLSRMQSFVAAEEAEGVEVEVDAIGDAMILTVRLPEPVQAITYSPAPALPPPDPEPVSQQPEETCVAERSAPLTDTSELAEEPDAGRPTAAEDGRGQHPAHAPEDAPITWRTGPWSEEERAELLRLHGEGRTTSEISRLMGRKGPGLSAVLRQELTRQDKAPPVKSEPAPKASPEPKPAQVPKPPRTEPPPEPPAAPVAAQKHPHPNYETAPAFDDSGSSALERAERRRLGCLERKDGWRIGDDADLIKRLCRGEKINIIATDLGVDAGWLKARYKKLCPKGSLDEQALVARLLRQMTEEA